MAEPLLTVHDLRVAFEDDAALDGVSFSLDQGESLVVIGPNGAGKTVLLRALLESVPHEGTVRWAEGIRIGYVPQKIDADRHLPITAQNLLDAKARTLGISAAAVRAVAAETGLDRKALRTPVGHLSGGQFQRALIAFALLGDPAVVILDEPTASIDKPGEEQIYELIHRLQDRRTLTVILVSHDLSVVYRYATKVLCLNKSGLCFGTPEEALTPKTLEALYGGPHKYFHHLHGDDEHTGSGKGEGYPHNHHRDA